MDIKKPISQTKDNNHHPSEDNYMDWTPRELETWCKNGLVPQYLLEPLRYFDLAFHLIINKEILRSNFRENTDNGRFQIIPYPSDLEQVHEIQIVNKNSRDVFRILEKSMDFELCEGIVLKIKAKELENWKKETF